MIYSSVHLIVLKVNHRLPFGFISTVKSLSLRVVTNGSCPVKMKIPRRSQQTLLFYKTKYIPVKTVRMGRIYYHWQPEFRWHGRDSLFKKYAGVPKSDANAVNPICPYLEWFSVREVHWSFEIGWKACKSDVPVHGMISRSRSALEFLNRMKMP